MRVLATALLAMCLVAATGAQGYGHAFDFHGMNPHHKRTELPDGRIHLSHDVHHVFPERGTFFKAKYEAIHDKKWHFVELHQHAEFLSQVNCGASMMELYVKHPSQQLRAELAKQNYEWTVLTAHQKFHCGETAIFRGVTGATYFPETDTLQIHTTPFTYVDVFEYLDYDQDTDHLSHEVEELPDDEGYDETYLPTPEEQTAVEEKPQGHGMQMQWKRWKKFKKKVSGAVKKVASAVKKVVNKAKSVVVNTVKKVVNTVKTIVKLFTGTFEYDKHWGLPKMEYNKDVSKKFSKWNFNGDFKLAVSAAAGAGVKFRISIKTFKFIIAEAYYYGYFRGGVRAQFSGRQKVDIKKDKQFANLKITTISFAIGPVPVVIIITAPIYGGYELDVDGRISLNMLLSVDGSIKQGLRMTKARGFEVINEKKWKTVRDFSPRTFSYSVGLTAYALIGLRANINFLGLVQASLKVNVEALLQSNSRCYLYLNMNLQPIITIQGAIKIGVKKMTIYQKNFGPKALVSWKIPLLNFCIPRRTTRRTSWLRRGAHQMLTMATSTDDATEPYNHHEVQETKAGTIDQNTTGITWFGDAECPNHPVGPMKMHFSMQFMDGNYTNTTEIILTAAQNVTTNPDTSINEETGETNFEYEMNNIQQTYIMPEELAPGLDANMTHFDEESPDNQYEANTTNKVKPVVAETIFIKVDPEDSTDITVISDTMFCGEVKLYARKWNDDNSTFATFSNGGGAPEQSLFEKLKAYAIYVPIICVVVLAVVLVIVVVQKKRASSAVAQRAGQNWGDDTNKDAAPMIDDDHAAASSVNADPRTDAL